MSEMYVFVKFERDEEPRACRICLNTEVALFSLFENGLVHTFAEFTGYAISATDGLPQHICSMCYAQLRKSSLFRTKCQGTQVLLQNELSRMPSITTEYIRNIDTSHLKLRLVVTDVETINLQENCDEQVSTNDKDKRQSLIVVNADKAYDLVNEEIDFEINEQIDDLDDSDLDLNDEIIDISLDEQPIDVNDNAKEEIFVKEEIVQTKEASDKKGLSKRSSDRLETKKLRKKLLKCSKEAKDTYKKLFYDYLLEKYVNKNHDKNVNRNVIDILDSDNEVKVDNAKDNFNLFESDTDNQNTTTDKNTNPNKKIFYKYLHEKYINKKTQDELKKIVSKSKTRMKKSVKDKRYKDENEIIAFAKTYNFDVVFLNKEEQIIELQARKQSLKYKKGRYRCELCFFGFQTETVFKKHMAVHDLNSGTHICNVCSMRFQRNTEMLEHHRRHHMLKYTCKECGKTVTYSSLAKQHYEYHKGVKYECEHCGKKYSKYASRMDHIRIHHGTTVCDICYETFQGPLGLKSHKTKAHKETAQCASCNANFDNKEALKRHIGASPSSACSPHVKPCTKCGHNFATSELLNEHISQTHTKQKASAESGYKLKKFQAKNKEKLCTCTNQEDKESTYNNQDVTRYHSNDRTDRYGHHSDGYESLGPSEYGSVCPSSESDKFDRYGAVNDGTEADKLSTFSTSEFPTVGLTAAVTVTINRDIDKCSRCGGRKRRPRKPKNFLCEICADRRFTSEAALKYHQRIHTGERPFQCPVCPKRFRVKENLHNHVNTHTGDRPYQCAHCPKAFRTNTAKHRHQLVHTKKRPFRCDICDKTFQTSTYLKVHVKTVHMKIPMPPRVRNRRRHLE